MFECLICMEEVCDHPMAVCEDCEPRYEEYVKIDLDKDNNVISVTQSD